jgi:predicted nucleotidyltransferase
MPQEKDVRFGLSENVIASISGVLSKYPEIEEAVIYGSRAKGNYRPGSDIDVALKGNISLTLLNRISMEIDDLLLPYTFDLAIYSHIKNDDLLNHIARAGKTLYSKQMEDPQPGVLS